MSKCELKLHMFFNAYDLVNNYLKYYEVCRAFSNKFI